MPRRPAFVILAAIELTMWLAGCGSYDSRWGRDPNKIRSAPPREDPAVIEKAKHDILDADAAPVADGANEDLSPVSVLFVNGEAISVEDVLRWIRYDLEQQAATLPADEYQGVLLEAVRKELRSQAENCLLHQQAKRQLGDIESDRLEQVVDERIRDIVNTQHGGRQSRYEEWLRARNISLAQDRERLRREVMITAYLQKVVTVRVQEPTRQEIAQFHEQYVQEQQARQKRRMLLIEVPVGRRDATGRTLTAPIPREHARQKCQQALAKLRSGADFAAVAQEYSEGLNASVGGDWGWVTKEGVRPRWKPAVEVLYTLADGQVSDVVETEDACFVVKCGGLEPIDLPDFAGLQPKLLESYRNRQFNLLTQELIAKLYNKAEVRPANPGRFLRAVLEAAPKPQGLG